MSVKVINQMEASEKVESLSEEFAVIQNPDFVHPEFEIIPLKGKIFQPQKIIAIVMDMDGTTTTTEELCVESFEMTIRKMSGLLDKKRWPGLNPKKDFQNVIGNSTTRHIEYLMETYKNLIDKKSTIDSFIESILWTIKTGKSDQRKKEAQELIKSFKLFEDFEKLIKLKSLRGSKDTIESLRNKLWNLLDLSDFSTLVKIGIEIYYMFYHKYLLSLNKLSNNDDSEKLVKPLPGVPIFLALIKGLLGEEAENVFENLIDDFLKKNPSNKIDFNPSSARQILRKIGIYFEKNPVKAALVTSSISYEANIALTEIFKQIRQEILTWKISESRKYKLIKKFSSYKKFYDAIVTATDAYEFRLKPHRDLYSIALYKLGISKNDFDKVVGFEDSQSGTVAVRAAGIGCSIALPFPQTKEHNYEAASYILWNGLPEFILKYNCLLKLD